MNRKFIEQTIRILLPGDFIALKMTGEAVTTVTGLSEGIFWDYKENGIAHSLLDFYEFGRGFTCSMCAGILVSREDYNGKPQRYWAFQKERRFVIGPGISPIMLFLCK